MFCGGTSVLSCVFGRRAGRTKTERWRCSREGREGRLSIWESSSKCQSSPQKSCAVEIRFHAAGKRWESWLESRLAAARDEVDMENVSFLHPAASAERSGAHGLNGSGNHGIVGESFPP